MKIVDVNGTPFKPAKAAYSGASGGFGNQLAQWTPPLQSVDAALLPKLNLANSRSDDLTRNNGYAAGGVQLHVDNIVGSIFRLRYMPAWKILGMTEEDSRAFANDVESAWLEHAEDQTGLYLDAERKRTFTMMIREGVATHCKYGEIPAAAEWIPRNGSLYNTAIKMVSPKRISNPDGRMDTNLLRGGVQMDRHGCALAYHVKNQNYSAGYDFGMFGGGKWRKVRRETTWGRAQFIHIFEPMEDGQTRGANTFLSSMEKFHMVDKLQSTKLQNAIVNAMYAATIESELSSDKAMEFMLDAQSKDTNEEALTAWMQLVHNYHQGANIKMDGVKVPHLFPGEKFNLQSPANSDNGYSDLEGGILRYIAAGTGVSYEQLARDYSKVNYSSARASMMESWRYFMGKRKVIASRFASQIFTLWLEEALHNGIIKMPRKARYNFYERKAAWSRSEWIGTGRLAIDGLKEVKEAVLRIESGLSTYEKECATMGEDYQEIFQQQVRETKEREAAGLPKPSWVKVTAFNEPADEQETTAA